MLCGHQELLLKASPANCHAEQSQRRASPTNEVEFVNSARRTLQSIFHPALWPNEERHACLLIAFEPPLLLLLLLRH